MVGEILTFLVIVSCIYYFLEKKRKKEDEKTLDDIFEVPANPPISLPSKVERQIHLLTKEF